MRYTTIQFTESFPVGFDPSEPLEINGTYCGFMMQKIQYKLPTYTPTGSGGTKETYSLGEPDFALVTNLNNRMEVAALQDVQGTVRKFEIRQRPSLNLKRDWLIHYLGVDYKILTAEPSKEKNFWIDVIAKSLK